MGEYKAKLLRLSAATTRRQIRAVLAHKLLSALAALPNSAPGRLDGYHRSGRTSSRRLGEHQVEKEVENSVRVERRVTFVSSWYQDLFQSKIVPWYVAIDEDGPK
jgi:hypothetical protein